MFLSYPACVEKPAGLSKRKWCRCCAGDDRYEDATTQPVSCFCLMVESCSLMMIAGCDITAGSCGTRDIPVEICFPLISHTHTHTHTHTHNLMSTRTSPPWCDSSSASLWSANVIRESKLSIGTTCCFPVSVVGNSKCLPQHTHTLHTNTHTL